MCCPHHELAGHIYVCAVSDDELIELRSALLPESSETVEPGVYAHNADKPTHHDTSTDSSHWSAVYASITQPLVHAIVLVNEVAYFIFADNKDVIYRHLGKRRIQGERSGPHSYTNTSVTCIFRPRPRTPA